MVPIKRNQFECEEVFRRYELEREAVFRRHDLAIVPIKRNQLEREAVAAACCASHSRPIRTPGHRRWSEPSSSSSSLSGRAISVPASQAVMEPCIFRSIE
jgi:hypothetical protein